MRFPFTAMALLALGGGSAADDASGLPGAVEQCLSCHLDDQGALDIVGVRALSRLPDEWQFLFEDEFDLDGDGVAGRIQFVSGGKWPLAAKFGQSLAAARFEDFALIAAAAHGVNLSAPNIIDEIEAAFEARSPAPTVPFVDDEAMRRFEVRGCAACHVTRTFEFDGETYMPLSDFLLHDLGDGEGLKRTAPLWGCPACVADGASAHAVPN
ncbi:MAG: hypothetical protein AAFO77_07450 [Pseudomonadota bacterium]